MKEKFMQMHKNYIMPCMPPKEPLVIVKGKGCYVEDTDGKKYLDCFAGIAVANLGHCHPKVVNAIQEQATKLHHCSNLYYTVPMAKLVEKLADVTPEDLKKSFLCNSGAEAVEGSIKLAKKYAFKKGKLGSEVISLDCSFHGRTALTLTLTGRKKYKSGLGGFANVPGILHAPAPYCYRCPMNLKYPECDIHCAKILEDVIECRTTGDVAAFILEPVMGEGGIMVPPPEYLPETCKICKDHDILFIADEVQSGFGRCGKMFAVEIWDIQPDIMTMAKGIASGMPIAAFIAKENIANAFEEGDHFSTYGGNPVVCAAALANIKIMVEEKIPERVEKIGGYLMEELQDLAKTHKVVGDIRGKGLMVGMELVKDRSKKTPAVDETRRVREEARKQGVLVGSGGIKKNVLRFEPPLIISEDQIDVLVNVLDTSLQKIS